MEKTALDKKINDTFPGLVVRKDLVKSVRSNAPVPGYVLEYLLGMYCATDDEATIAEGIEQVKEILRVHYVNRNEAELVKSKIKEKGHHKIIDCVSVELNAQGGFYEMSFQNLGIKRVPIDVPTVKNNKKLLVGGVWCMIDVQYDIVEEKNVSPWSIRSLKPIQMSGFDKEAYLAARAQMTSDEWVDMLLQTIGFNPEKFGRRHKLFQLLRLVPFTERNYNLMELGPKGTGKSHIYSQCSPHGMLLSGGEVSLAKLFVNNSSEKIGLVGYWDCIAFDEFAGRDKKPEKRLVDVMKNYMANHSFSRGVGTMDAEASFAMVGNTAHNVPYMLKNTNLFDSLPNAYLDSAFLDRIHNYLPGWEVYITRGELFTTGYGLIVDYLSEALHVMREMDFTGLFQKYFTISPNLSERDKEGVRKTFSGLMKIIYPSGVATKEEMRELLAFVMEGRKRVKDNLMRIDSTYDPVDFWFEDLESGEKTYVQTLEEKEFPEIYRQVRSVECGVRSESNADVPATAPMHNQAVLHSDQALAITATTPHSALNTPNSPKEGVVSVSENQTGIDFEFLFAKHINGAREILIVDPFIRKFHQARNMMDLLSVVLKLKAREDEVVVKLRTARDDIDPAAQEKYLEQISDAYAPEGIVFTWEFLDNLHDRWIDTDTGWHIIMGRGLDIFQQFDGKNAFDIQNVVPSRRQCKSFSVTYIKR
ncbi:MAG: BREX system Lon protease-like protein BrxL [Kiritimatiellae bacterium]|nr:BREX system Lon protease-like protein BrxL [Kiritimatiellia bacterium]